MKNQLILSALVALGTPVLMAQGYFDDDIYYDPKKDQTTSFQKKKKKSNYIANMADMDVDTYNRRGEQYYATPIDTIGAYAENGEDFVYTQQIQKYYNPTIVVDNADVLGDLLANSYGNVEIVIDNNGLPIFSPYTYSPWSYRYYPGWGFNAGPWGWSVGFYDPWYSWNWGWNWGPSWAWGPSWGWGPSWVGDHPGEDLSVEVVRQWRIGVLPEIVLRHHVRVGHQPRVPVEILLIVSLPDPALPDVRHLVHARVICHRGDQYHVQEVAPVLSIIMAGGNTTQVAQQVIVRPAQVS